MERIFVCIIKKSMYGTINAKQWIASYILGLTPSFCNIDSEKQDPTTMRHNHSKIKASTIHTVNVDPRL